MKTELEIALELVDTLTQQRETNLMIMDDLLVSMKKEAGFDWDEMEEHDCSCSLAMCVVHNAREDGTLKKINTSLYEFYEDKAE